MLPNFLIIGAQKSGTTSLFRYLETHPQVFGPHRKELDFFVEENGEWARGVSWYERQFDGAGDAIAIGEASPSYTKFPSYAGVPARIKSVLPDVRLIYIMRDPIERMRSNYLHGLAEGVEHRPIGEALLHDSRYIDGTRYAMQLHRYGEHFDRSQFLLLTTEALNARPAETMARVLDFLGVDSSLRLHDLGVRHNAGSLKRRAPRAGWRALGSFLITHPRAARAVPRRVSWLQERALTTRAVRPDELMLTEDLRARLTDLIRYDVERLVPWMDAGFDGWGLLE